MSAVPSPISGDYYSSKMEKLLEFLSCSFPYFRGLLQLGYGRNFEIRSCSFPYFRGLLQHIIKEAFQNSAVPSPISGDYYSLTTWVNVGALGCSFPYFRGLLQLHADEILSVVAVPSPISGDYYSEKVLKCLSDLLFLPLFQGIITADYRQIIYCD